MDKEIFTVSELNQAARKLLEGQFPAIWVEGELSNVARPGSGHLYFSLKDKEAQIRCAMFRPKSLHLNFEPKGGLLVQVQAKVSIYPDRGDYQLIVEQMVLAGDGLLRIAYEQLLRKLAALGLFQEKWKKPLPPLPRHIGVITSPTGAAIRDILSVLKRRFPSIPVTIYPTKVQGQEAAPEIVKAIDLAHQHNLCDVLIIGRGGGSLEDLWPFNEEAVAHAIFASQIPIVSAVGHEIDFTIADFVADKRAATPSAAAELLSPHQATILEQLDNLIKRLINEIDRSLQYHYQRVDWLTKRLRHPGHQLSLYSAQLQELSKRLFFAIERLIKDKQFYLVSSLRALDTVSPLATLNRGYAIVKNDKTHEIIRSAQQVQKGQRLCIRVHEGELYSVVE